MKKSSENIAGFFHWTTQPNLLSINHIYSSSCVYSVKLKNLKANHNLSCEHRSDCAEIIGIIANIPLYNFEYNRNIAIFTVPNNTQYEV